MHLHLSQPGLAIGNPQIDENFIIGTHYRRRVSHFLSDRSHFLVRSLASSLAEVEVQEPPVDPCQTCVFMWDETPAPFIGGDGDWAPNPRLWPRPRKFGADVARARFQLFPEAPLWLSSTSHFSCR